VGRIEGYLVPAALGATCLVLAFAPVTAFVVLFPAWLAAPLAIAPRRALRVLGAALALFPLLFTGGVLAAAMLTFHRAIAPASAALALYATPAVSLALAALALLPRRRPIE
jgi:hypothetical protein